MHDTLTVCITIGGTAERTIKIASQTFLFDSAYARRAENAINTSYTQVTSFFKDRVQTHKQMR